MTTVKEQIDAVDKKFDDGMSKLRKLYLTGLVTKRGAQGILAELVVLSKKLIGLHKKLYLEQMKELSLEDELKLED